MNEPEGYPTGIIINVHVQTILFKHERTRGISHGYNYKCSCLNDIIILLY